MLTTTSSSALGQSSNDGVLDAGKQTRTNSGRISVMAVKEWGAYQRWLDEGSELTVGAPDDNADTT